MDDERRIIFELFGEDGSREEFAYDNQLGIANAIDILKSGWYLLGSIDELGFREALEAAGLKIDEEPDQGN